MIRKVDISHKTIFFITGFLALLWAIFNIRDLILIVFTAIIIVSAIAPLVEALAHWKIPRYLAIAIVYVLVFGALIGVLTLGITPITTQTFSLIQRMTDALNHISSQYNINATALETQIPNLSQNILTFTADIFQGFITMVLIVVISIYLMSDKGRVESRFSNLFGDKASRVNKLLHRIESKLGGWLRGQLFLSLIVGVLIYAGLVLIGIDFALPLAIIAGLFEIVPFFGPILSAIPAILIGIITTPLAAAMVVGLYILVQQVESHVLVPQVMKKAVGLNPLVVILAIAIGNRLLGLSGALLAVPIAVVCQVILDDYLHDGGEVEDLELVP